MFLTILQAVQATPLSMTAPYTDWSPLSPWPTLRPYRPVVSCSGREEGWPSLSHSLSRRPSLLSSRLDTVEGPCSTGWGVGRATPTKTWAWSGGLPLKVSLHVYLHRLVCVVFGEIFVNLSYTMLLNSVKILKCVNLIGYGLLFNITFMSKNDWIFSVTKVSPSSPSHFSLPQKLTLKY